MQHPEIESECLVDRYVRNTLPPAQRQAFEEHFLDCPLCLDQLEAASSLRQGLREEAVEAASAARPMERASPNPGWFRWWLMAGAFACVAISAGTSVVFFRQAQSARRELAGVQTDYSRVLANAGRFALSPMVYILGQNRGGTQSKEIALPREPRWMVFSVEIDTSQYNAYRATLTGGDGRQVWEQNQIQPASPDALAVTAPSNVLAPGSYILAIETPGGDHATLARFLVQLH